MTRSAGEGRPAAASRGEAAELYRRHHRNLHRAVSDAVNAPRELIEDACQNAWTMLVRAKPTCVSTFVWLYGVATREAYQLREAERRHTHPHEVLAAGSCGALIADAFCIDDILEAREALDILASLSHREREDLTLVVAGFTYDEIAEMTGGRTFTNVRKHVDKAYARVRRARVRGKPRRDEPAELSADR